MCPVRLKSAKRTTCRNIPVVGMKAKKLSGNLALNFYHRSVSPQAKTGTTDSTMHTHTTPRPPVSDPKAARISDLSQEYLTATADRKEAIGDEIAAMIEGRVVSIGFEPNTGYRVAPR